MSLYTLPDYVERGGQQVWRPPYTAKEAELFGFVVKADRAAIDRLLTRDLVEPAHNAVDYRCAHDHVVVVFAEIKRLGSGDPRDRLRGYLSEREVSVWCLAADVSAGGRLVWYLPYVFVDSGEAAISGREVYGYPKELGVFENNYLEGLRAGGTTTVSGLAIESFGNEAILKPMIAATRTTPGAPAPGAPAPPASTSFDDVLALFADGLAVNEQLPFGPGPAASAVITPIDAPPPAPAPLPTVPPWAARRVLDTLSGRQLDRSPEDLIPAMVDDPTLVFLKQFRDVSCPGKACYQAVVEAPLDVHVETASYTELRPEEYKVTIKSWASHPIAAELGVGPGAPLQPVAAFRATGLDFDIRLGLEVWRAPT